jgi:hypothetical protein
MAIGVSIRDLLTKASQTTVAIEQVQEAHKIVRAASLDRFQSLIGKRRGTLIQISAELDRMDLHFEQEKREYEDARKQVLVQLSEAMRDLLQAQHSLIDELKSLGIKGEVAPLQEIEAKLRQLINAPENQV